MNIKQFSILLLGTVCLGFTMCTKSSTTASSTFTVNSLNYKQGPEGTHYDTSQQLLFCGNDTKDSLMVNFLTKPTHSGTYTVMDDDLGTLTATNCGVDCIIAGGLVHDYHSIGKAGDVVQVTVSSSGKLTAVVTNVSVIDTTNIVTVTGTLVEQ